MISTLENGSVERIKLIMKPSAKTSYKHVCRNIHRMLFPRLGDICDMIMNVIILESSSNNDN